jgi:hypothetical protein
MTVSIAVQREIPGGKLAQQAGQAELDRCFGRPGIDGHLSWLYLDWMGSDYETPMERWVIYQMIPRRSVGMDMKDALDGPHPSKLGYWTNKVEMNQWQRYVQWKTGKRPVLPKRTWVSTAPIGLTHRKWELWRAFQCEAQLYWVIQGHVGGHKYKVHDLIEMQLRELGGLSPDTPSVGALPYAPFDTRVIDQLAHLDLEQIYTRCALPSRNDTTFTQDERDLAQKVRALLLKQWEDQSKEIVDDLGMTGKGGWWSKLRSECPYDPNLEEEYETIEQQFMEDVSIHAA